jgi:acyl-coenzyme A thioesterase PaaI-like protein
MSASVEQDLLAAGWEKIQTEGFTAHVGPFWRRVAGGDVEIGLIVEDRHCNSHMGTLHGGMVMTFADIALGSGAARRLGVPRFNGVTASLNTQFVAVAHVGEFISCKPEVIHQGKQMFFMRGLIITNSKVVASCEGIWKLISRKIE